MIPLQHQAAGHEGPLQNEDGSLFIKPTNAQEIEFYNETQIRRSKLSDDKPYGDSLSDWMPQYVGVLYPGASDDLIRESNGTMDEKLLNKALDTLEIEGENKQYLILNNCLHGFSQPSIMDIKLGSILYDSNANADKVERMKKVSQQTTSGTLSFRIAGMKIKDHFNKLPGPIKGINMDEACKTDNGYLFFTKYFGRKLTKDTIQEGLRIFFRYNNLPKNVQDLMIENFFARLQILYNCLLDEEIRVVSGSLLFIFENDINRWKTNDYQDQIVLPPLIMESDGDDEEDEIELQDDSDTPLSTLKFIDFAHAEYVPGKGYDEEIVSGIENLFKIIEHI